MPNNRFKEENERLRKEAEDLRLELVKLSQKVESALQVLKGEETK